MEVEDFDVVVVVVVVVGLAAVENGVVEETAYKDALPLLVNLVGNSFVVLNLGEITVDVSSLPVDVDDVSALAWFAVNTSIDSATIA